MCVSQSNTSQHVIEHIYKEKQKLKPVSNLHDSHAGFISSIPPLPSNLLSSHVFSSVAGSLCTCWIIDSCFGFDKAFGSTALSSMGCWADHKAQSILSLPSLLPFLTLHPSCFLSHLLLVHIILTYATHYLCYLFACMYNVVNYSRLYSR